MSNRSRGWAGLAAAAAMLAVLAGCGGGSTATKVASAVTVTVTPRDASMIAGGTQAFTAVVVGSTSAGVTWSVQEGAAGGSITAGGAYTAPTTPGVYHVVAASAADPAATGVATVFVRPTGVYTVNGGGGWTVPGTASFVNTAQNNQVTARAFDVGIVPNWMVIRGNEGYVVNSISGNVQIVNLASGATLGTINTGAGTNPMKLAVAADGTGYVTNLMANTVGVINLVSRTLTGTIDLSAYGTGPTGIAVANNKVYVTLTNAAWNGTAMAYSQGKVVVIPVGSTQVSKAIDVPMNPGDAAVDASGRVHVACTGDYGATAGAVAIINSGSDVVQTTVALGGTPYNLTITPSGKAFVADSSYGVTAYDANTGAILKGPSQAITRTGAMVLDVRYDPQTRLVYAADFTGDRLLVIDPALESITSEVIVGDGPTAIGVFEQ